MKKTLLIMFLLVGFLLPVNAVYASDEGFDGDLTYEEGGKAYILTEEDEKLLEEKNQEILKFNDNKNNDNILQPMYYPDGEYRELSVPVFKQANGYYCGPATVKQVTHFIKGSSSSQSYYAGKLGTTKAGTDMTVIANYLKNNVKSNYVYASIGTFDAWMNKVNYGMKNKMPGVIDINTKNISAFPYDTDTGHFVNMSGYDTKFGPGVKVRITDPFGPGLGNRWYNARDVYNANNNHFRRAIIW
ncbi:C39 family peptidase [Irregularibacter muris]|uniref:C39 family peptidase n=1 Tax=Irregularibacter muris TaxID=1796619 RepID=A0AAE3HFD8_9FIRM|nr:C39 family peptidase [Irregularibacter muris]MCR1898492.1 C39 family peptidase [Irregularibacter muris]